MGDTMKKFILISFCLCVILGVILLNRGRNVNVDIVSKYFVNGNKTFYYPLFNRENIDNYIWEYLNSNMDYGDKLFLDYDYRDNEEGVTITFYFYGEKQKLNKEIMTDISLEEALKIINISLNEESLNRILENINIFRDSLLKENKKKKILN